MLPALSSLYEKAKSRSARRDITNFDVADQATLFDRYVFKNDSTKISFQDALTDDTHIPFIEDLQKSRITQEQLNTQILYGTIELLRVDFPSSSDEYKKIDKKCEFMRHLETSIGLLLSGPPNANRHTINPDQARIWINAQHSEERKRLAGLVVKNARYISHAEFIAGINKCVDMLAERYDRSLPVIFIVGSPTKSNYYVSLLFAHFWLSRGLFIDYVIDSFGGADTISVSGNVFDIDDMGYSGSQTEKKIRGLFRSLYRKIKKHLERSLKNKLLLDFCPDFLIEYMLSKIGFKYYLVRIFSSSLSVRSWASGNFKMPLDLVCSEFIPSLQEIVGESDGKKIVALFESDISSTFVYFDHKVADSASTTLHPFAFGYIPTKKAINRFWFPKNYLSETNLAALNANLKDKDVAFHPFIDGCLYSDGRKELSVTNVENVENQKDEFRCPYAWYKSINYDTGTYMPPSAGGARKKTKKAKRSKKMRTRKNA